MEGHGVMEFYAGRYLQFLNCGAEHGVMALHSVVVSSCLLLLDTLSIIAIKLE